MPAEIASSGNWTVEGIIAKIPERDLKQLDALGDVMDKSNWTIGAYAEKLIEQGPPKGLVYLALAKVVGRRSTTIRNCYYVHKMFTSGDRETFYSVRWSVFVHASRCVDPDAVLAYAQRTGAGVDEIEVMFPASDRQEDESRVRNVPVWAASMYRDISGYPAESYQRIDGWTKLIIAEIKKVEGSEK